MKYCPSCGSQNESDSLFCAICGEILSKNYSQSAEKPDPSYRGPVYSNKVPRHSYVQPVPPNQSQQGPSYVLASWPARFVAWLLDGIFLGVVLVILVAIGFSVGLASDFRPGPMVAFLVPLFIFWVFIDFGYGPIMEYFYGATFGKMILGLKVVDVKTGEKPTSFLKVLVSNLGKELLLFWDVLLGLLVSDCAKMNQRIFQRAVDLVVIRNGVTSPGYV